MYTIQRDDIIYVYTMRLSVATMYRGSTYKHWSYARQSGRGAVWTERQCSRSIWAMTNCECISNKFTFNIHKMYRNYLCCDNIDTMANQSEARTKLIVWIVTKESTLRIVYKCFRWVFLYATNWRCLAFDLFWGRYISVHRFERSVYG